MFTRQRGLVLFTVLLGLATAVGGPLRAQGVRTLHGIPMFGNDVPTLSSFDEVMTTFMSANGISGGQLALASGSQIVFQRSYGWTSSQKTAYLRPDAVMRLASVTKPITKAAIRKLASEGRLSLSDRAICINNNTPCQLQITPYRTADSRLGTITVQHLLDHTGGWDRDITPDLTYQYTTIARDLGIGMPPSREDTVRWIAGRPLDFNPGARYAYSNVGYMLLGMIVEKASGQPFFDYVRQQIFEPSGVSPADVIMARTLPQDRDRREPAYEDPYMTGSVFPPNGWVAEPDGGFYLEARTGVGNVATTSRAYAQFLTRYTVLGFPRNGAPPSDMHDGAYAGTRTLARQYTNGVSLVVFFNRQTSPAGVDVDLGDLRLDLDSVVSQTNWNVLQPINPPDAGPLPTPSPSAAPARAAIRITTNPGSPVPYSGAPASGCGSGNGTWFYDETLEETSGIAFQLLERIQVFDGRESSRTTMNNAVRAGTRYALNFYWCSNPASSHTVRTDFNIRDGNGNTFTVTGPVITLRPR